MTQPTSTRLPARPPAIAAPAPFRERRVAHRRVEDRAAHQEKVLLARSLDILAAGLSAEARLAGMLALLAETAGARRAAVLADGAERRCAVAIEPGEDPAEAEALAKWLDAASTRSRAQRAASAAASVAFVLVAAPQPEQDVESSHPYEPAARPVLPSRDQSPTPIRVPDASPDEPADGPWYAMVRIPTAGTVVLGFEFDDAEGKSRIRHRLGPQLARHAAVALALVTEQFGTERELATLRAGEAERATFVSTVAHELRTPLTGLRGYLDLILGDQVRDPAVAAEFLERSRGIVDAMTDLVGDLLDLSRLESGAIAIELEPFSLAEAAEDVIARLVPIALEHDIRLEHTLPPKLRIATGDRRRVEQILTNLAANALKFTPPGGAVELIATFDGPVAIVVVRDDGSGIDARDRVRIFERFHRLADHERIVGTGLGLPIARDLARQMNGDLDVASVRGAGSAFVLALPGPTPVEPADVSAALTRALREQEVELDERGVLRSLGWAKDTRRRSGLGVVPTASDDESESGDAPSGVQG
jgi:signal transduction histidine kinase